MRYFVLTTRGLEDVALQDLKGTIGKLMRAVKLFYHTKWGKIASAK